jgi:lipopolysaccharide/colanic/teichoic acid biosynthesis glycosyltransferase
LFYQTDGQKIGDWLNRSQMGSIENFEEGVKLDIGYIENWSLWLDLRILLKTVLVVLFKKGAY